MDCRVDDDQIIPVTHRLICDLGKLPDDWPYSTDGRGVLAYSAAERDAIATALDELTISYTVEEVDQPDAAHLAALQGNVSSRSEALDALAALGQGDTPDIPELRLRKLESDVADLKAAEVAKA